MTHVDAQLIPESPAQLALAQRIDALERDLARWMIETGGRDHRRRPDPRDGPGYKDLVAAIHEFTRLKNARL